MTLASGGLAFSASAEPLTYRVEGTVVDWLTDENPRELSGEVDLEPVASWERVLPNGTVQRSQIYEPSFELELDGRQLVQDPPVTYEGLESVIPGVLDSHVQVWVPHNRLMLTLFADDGPPEAGEPDPGCESFGWGCVTIVEPVLGIVGGADDLPIVDPVPPPRFHLHGGLTERRVTFWVMHSPCYEGSPFCDVLNPIFGGYERQIADVDVTFAALSRVAVDVLPGGLRGRRPVLAVVVRGSESFDVEDLELASLRLGPGGPAPLTHRGRIPALVLDGNRDGWSDLVLLFRRREALAGERPEELCLTGDLADGSVVEGCDELRLERHRDRERSRRGS